MKTNNKKPILGITMGDPASIGPEVAVKALANAGIYEICKPLLVGDAEICKDAIRFCGLDLVVNAVKDVKDAKFEFGSIDVYDLEYASADIVTGQNSVAAGAAAFNTVVKVIDLAMKGLVDATVTGPINKESIHLAGHKFSGHTEIYAHYTDTKKYGMLLVEDDLRVIHEAYQICIKRAFLVNSIKFTSILWR